MNVIRRDETLYDYSQLPGQVEAIRQQARQFAQKEILPIAPKVNAMTESVEAFPRPLAKKIAKEGFYGVPFPKSDGGLGLEQPGLATHFILEEFAYFSNGIAAAFFDAPISLAGACLSQHGSDYLKQNYLAKILNGESIPSFATSEPAASTDLSVKSLQTMAEKVEGGYRINGKKRWITNAIVADFVVLLCRSEDTLSVFVVDLDQDGVTVSPPDKKMGNNVQLDLAP